MGSVAKKQRRKRELQARRGARAEKTKLDSSSEYRIALEALKATPVLAKANPVLLRTFLERCWRKGLDITQSRAEWLAACNTLAECDEMIADFRESDNA